MKGLITASSSELFQTEVIVNQLATIDDNTVIFEVINKSIDPNSEAFERIKSPIKDSSLSVSPNNLFFSVETLCETFPFHFIFKRNFRIVEIGNSLKRYISPTLTSKSTKIMFSDVFIVSRPIIELNFETIATFCNHLFLLTMREEYVSKRKRMDNDNPNRRPFSLTRAKTSQNPQLQLKGQMVMLPAFDSIMFVGSPKIVEIDQMFQLDLTLTDFPISDQTGTNIAVRTFQSNNKELIAKIDEAANHLKIVEKKLR